eukprot:CAMPEP_0194066628 /NCGR_PEP_ID=MMETSP0009_2-20130614/86129_1 /TAXON_ID=210454 /ORGANISM="Grammatophora oceanica, Strain CCMP 410" /LENGTH=53 /DNA_ID=CAMNT_0038719601 /DNA_START=1025 /DNA_END=1183 /DNA_ORIENTATION=+
MEAAEETEEMEDDDDVERWPEGSCRYSYGYMDFSWSGESLILWFTLWFQNPHR